MSNENINNKIQCLECGNWYKSINTTHLKKCCGFTVLQYRKKYPDAIIVIFTKQHCKNLSIASKKAYKNGIKISPNKGKELSNNYKQKISNTLKNRKFSDEHKQNLSIAGKKLYKNGYIHPMQGKKHSDKTREKQRLSRLKDIEKKYGIACPNYSLNACKFFDWLNQEFNLNGQYALNKGEYHIKELGYFLDYYESDLNLVIEWDEPHHKYKKEKDKIRQQEITDFLNCTFIRIKEDEFKIYIEKSLKNE